MTEIELIEDVERAVIYLDGEPLKDVLMRSDRRLDVVIEGHEETVSEPEETVEIDADRVEEDVEVEDVPRLDQF